MSTYKIFICKYFSFESGELASLVAQRLGDLRLHLPNLMVLLGDLMASKPVVVITGCSSGGIGYHLAEQFHKQGCWVFATARRLASMQGLAALGPNMDLVQLDVCSSDSIKAAVAQIMSKAGRIDVLVNNAGVVMLGPSAEVPMASVRECFAANVFGLLELCQAVLPIMALQGSGKLVNISSLTGFTPVPFRGIYSASKAAVMRLSDALRLECRPLGISLMVVAPGFIDTRARDTAKETAAGYSSGAVQKQRTLWPGWMDVLDLAMRKLLRNVVPADLYAHKLAVLCLRSNTLPRYWVGPCAGAEWLVRFLPAALQDLLLSRSLGLVQLEPVLRQNVEQLRATQQQQQQL